MSVRTEIEATYRASGYDVAAAALAYAFRASRSDGEGAPALLVALPFEVEARPPPEQIVADIARARLAEPGLTCVVALPKNTSLGSQFQSAVTDAGAVFQSYAGILDGGFGGGMKVGLGTKSRGRAEQLGDALFDYGKLDAGLIDGVVRKRYRDEAAAAIPTRVVERFFVRKGPLLVDRSADTGRDLLRHMIAHLEQPSDGPEVFLIVGPGGAGKTWLFEALFTYLYEGFQLAKAAQDVAPRPIAVVPASLIGAGASTGRDLFEAVGRTEYGEAGGLGLLDHQVRSGRNILMFDGLDEFFAEDQDLAGLIEGRYLMPGSRSRLLIVLRDSLLETSPLVQAMVRRFAQSLGQGQRFHIYEVAPWDAAEMRDLAWYKLERRRPEPGEPDTPVVAGFLAGLAAKPRMAELARLAFYCDLMVDLHGDWVSGNPPDGGVGTALPADEYDLLGICFERIVDREIAKHAVRDDAEPEGAFLETPAEAVFERIMSQMAASPSGLGDGSDLTDVALARIKFDASGGRPDLMEGRRGLESMIEQAAYLARRRSTAPGLTAEGLKALYHGAATGAEPEDRALGERILRQFVLFVQGPNAGTVDFGHEIMADYLAARHVVERALAGAGTVAQLIGVPVAGETEVFRGTINREMEYRARGAA